MSDTTDPRIEAEALLETIKAELKRETQYTSASDSRTVSAGWLRDWFGIHRKPAKTIASHWSDEPEPEAK
ncbi:hypothetical protein [Gluconobacter morbifer]|uniref:hypothetical protein n=1 Tax=Gluconobacter morbifer TaxID=479935 RepID=UPI001111ED91|nr:hypothetical protein [Gluconobacter morbifer]